MKMELFKKKEFYLSISEGMKGIEYFIDDDIKKLPHAIRRSIITFLTIAIIDLQDKDKDKIEK